MQALSDVVQGAYWQKESLVVWLRAFCTSARWKAGRYHSVAFRLLQPKEKTAFGAETAEWEVSHCVDGRAFASLAGKRPPCPRQESGAIVALFSYWGDN